MNNNRSMLFTRRFCDLDTFFLFISFEYDNKSIRDKNSVVNKSLFQIKSRKDDWAILANIRCYVFS